MGNMKSAFPAYSQANGQSSSANNPHSQNPNSNLDKPEMNKKPALISLSTDNSRIIHPEEDISLEEMRAAMPRYACQVAPSSRSREALPPPTSVPSSQPPTTSHQNHTRDPSPSVR